MLSEQTEEDSNCISVFPQDGLLIGKAEILNSPNVSQAKTQHTTLPVPSIYEDDRGSIQNLSVGPDEKRYNILHTKSGAMRSGDIHPNTQHDFIFEGAVELWLLTPDGRTQKTLHYKGSYIRIPPFVPHIFNFVQDTIMAEWWEPQGFQAWFYTPYRNIVERSVTIDEKGNKLSDQTGRTIKGKFTILKKVFKEDLN